MIREPIVLRGLADRHVARVLFHPQNLAQTEAVRMAFRLSARSLGNLEGVHPDLVRVVKRAIQITRQDFVVIEGVRTPERQRELYAQGRSKPGKKVTWTLTSNHFKKADGYGHAVDLCPYPVDWSDLRKFAEIAKAMKLAARDENVSIAWGGDWRTNKDSPHFELARP